MTSNKLGPFYTDEAECVVSGKGQNHLRFRIPASPDVFTALEVSPTPTRELPPDSPKFQEMQKKAWYPNRKNIFCTCFIKLKVVVIKADSSDSSLVFFVSSLGLQGLLSDAWSNFLFGFRLFEVGMSSGGGFYCIEYKCSGTLEETDIDDFTQVRIALPTTSPYRCKVEAVKESLKEYSFGEDNRKKNSYWGTDWAFNYYRSYIDIYAPTNYGGSYGIQGFTTDNQNNPKQGRQVARENGYYECMGSHDVHDGGAAVHLICNVPDKK